MPPTTPVLEARRLLSRGATHAMAKNLHAHAESVKDPIHCACYSRGETCSDFRKESRSFALIAVSREFEFEVAADKGAGHAPVEAFGESHNDGVGWS